MTVFNKSGLAVEVQTSFPDNKFQQITPEILRQYLDNQIDSSLAFRTQIINSTPATINDDTDLAIFAAGASEVTLAIISDFKSRALTILNQSGGDVTALPGSGDTIGGQASAILADDFGAIIAPAGTDWGSIIDSNRFRLSRLLDTLFSNQATGDLLQWNGSIWINRPRRQFASFYEEDAGTITTINTSLVFEDLNNTLTKDLNGYHPDLIVADSTVTWIGDYTAMFILIFNVSAETANSNNQKYQFRMIKNGVEPIFGKTEINASNVRADSGCICATVELEPSDEITLQVAAVGHTTNVEVEEITFCVQEMQ